MLQSRIFVGMVLVLIFGEVLGLYGQVEFLDQGHLKFSSNHDPDLSLLLSSIHVPIEGIGSCFIGVRYCTIGVLQNGHQLHLSSRSSQ